MHLAERVIIASDVGEVETVPLVGVGKRRVDLERSAERLLGGGISEKAHLGVRERRPRRPLNPAPAPWLPPHEPLPMCLPWGYPRSWGASRNPARGQHARARIPGRGEWPVETIQSRARC